MDVEFVIQDTFALIRPQWKAASDITEAARLFAEAVAVNYKVQETDKAPDLEDDADSSSSDEDIEDDALPDGEEDHSSGDEAEVWNGFDQTVAHRMIANMLKQGVANNIDHDSDSESDEDEEEEIFVARQEEERDPEAEADFDRAFEKMMSESLESRKFERKSMFDVPLPMKRSTREPAAEENKEPSRPATSTMAFSLMTKRGNRQQVVPFFPFSLGLLQHIQEILN